MAGILPALAAAGPWLLRNWRLAAAGVGAIGIVWAGWSAYAGIRDAAFNRGAESREREIATLTAERDEALSLRRQAEALWAAAEARATAEAATAAQLAALRAEHEALIASVANGPVVIAPGSQADAALRRIAGGGP